MLLRHFKGLAQHAAGGWRVVPLDLPGVPVPGVTSVARRPDGALVAGIPARASLVYVPPGGGPRRHLDLASLGGSTEPVTKLAWDDRGRVWAHGSAGLTVLAPDFTLARHFVPGSMGPLRGPQLRAIVPRGG
jgi:hypothetical protein